MVIAIIVGILFLVASVWILFFSHHNDGARLSARSNAQRRIDRNR